MGDVEVIEVEQRVGRELPGHHDDPRAGRTHRRERVRRAGEQVGGRDRVVGIELAEAVHGRPDGVGRQVGTDQLVERWAEP